MYLPLEILKAKVLIVVKTYPNPSAKYDELVCNAGFLENGQWIRVYPIPFRSLSYSERYKKFDWIELDLVRSTADFRPESYRPKQGVDEHIEIVGHIDTGKKRDWRNRKKFALREVFGSMKTLIELTKQHNVWKSLATVKPKELIKFEIAPDEREWKPRFQQELQQMKLFDQGKSLDNREWQVVRKLPYKYYYHFLTEGDTKPRRMMIEDWEIGALYWNCLKKTDGDEEAANQLVRRKYETEFFAKDLYLFVGTTRANHIKAPNPFVIIGVFPPPVELQLSLF